MEAWSESVPSLPAGFADSVMALVSEEQKAESKSDAIIGQAMQAWSDSLSESVSAESAQKQLESIVATSLHAEALEQPAPMHQQAVMAWSEEGVPSMPANFADTVMAAAGVSIQAEAENTAQIPAKTEAPTNTSHGPSEQGAKVVPLRQRSKWVAPAAMSSLLAAAAVTVIALAPGLRSKPTVPPTPHTHTAQNNNTHTANPPPQQTPHNETARAPEALSSVDKVRVDGDRTSYTVLALPGEDETTTVAVVWIEDGDKRPM